MAKAPSKRKAQAAWDRLMALGGSGVWDADTVFVCLADTAVTDDDLAAFRDFPFVQSLDISRTAVTGAGLVHLCGAAGLEQLIAVGTKLGRAELTEFRAAHPGVQVVAKPPPKGAVNPFTGEPLG